MFSTHHAINNQLCIPFWLKLQRKGAFSKALLAFHKSHSNLAWNCSGERPKSWSGEAWEAVCLLLQTEPSTFWENLAFSLRKLIWIGWIGKHHLLHLLVKCRSYLQKEQHIFLPFPCMLILRSKRQTLLLPWQHFLMYCVIGPFPL